MMDRISDMPATARPSGRVNPWRVIGASCIVVAGFCLVAGILFFGTSNRRAANKDFIEYWAAGQQLIHGANPYDGGAILRLERAVGLDSNKPRITFSPPVAFFMVLPLGFLSAKMGLTLWSLALLTSLSLSNWILWIINGRPANRYHLLGYLFPPVLICLMAGQLGIFLLFGVVLFLYLHKSHPYLGGAALLPCALKPHLFLPVAIVLLLWTIDRKAYRILGGFTIILLASCAFALCFDVHVWSQYSRMMKTTGVLDAFVPTLSVMFRFIADRNAVWIQFLPEAGGCAWATWYFWTQRSRWDWTDQGLLLLLVSALCTPYAWFSDEAVLLPAVLAALYRASNSGRSLLPLGLIGWVALIEVLAVVQMTSKFYLWTVPAWLAWYLYAFRATAAQPGKAYDPPPLAEGREATL
jgi:hypothetical protein